MADFAQWGAALTEAMGYSRGEFFKKYQESVDRKWQETAEDSTFAKKLVDLIEKKGGFWGKIFGRDNDRDPDEPEPDAAPRSKKGGE